jgi:CDP-diacylglycerol--serine O-phosphatidyltransferase
VKCVVAGGVCDAFDGAVARATRSGGRFGEELDSLVDAISFGFAPAMIVYFAVLPRDGWAWLPVFIFAACAVIRLARFNVTQAGASKSYFIGLPSPAAGGTLATYYWFTQTRLYQETRIVDLPWQEVMQGTHAAARHDDDLERALPDVAQGRACGRSRASAGCSSCSASSWARCSSTSTSSSSSASAISRSACCAPWCSGLLDLPPGGRAAARRATDFVDPMEAYGSPRSTPTATRKRRRFGRRRAPRAPTPPPPRERAARPDPAPTAP